MGGLLQFIKIYTLFRMFLLIHAERSKLPKKYFRLLEIRARRTFFRYFVCSQRVESEYMNMGLCLCTWLLVSPLSPSMQSFSLSIQEPFNVNY